MKNASLTWRQTKQGHVTSTYWSLHARSKLRGHATPKYSKFDFVAWLYTQTEYHIIYDKWVESNFEKQLSPSVDRLDNSKGYDFDNIQVVTWAENQANAHRDFRLANARMVQGTHLQSGEKEVFQSITDAASDTGVAQYNIVHCCAGRRGTAGGYSWRYLTS